MRAGPTYFPATACSFPFLGVYNAAAVIMSALAFQSGNEVRLRWRNILALEGDTVGRILHIAVPGGIVCLSLPLILRFYNLEAETLQLAVLLIVMHNLFELLGLDTMIVNAARMKAVPGRKTDSKDAEWIAEQLHYGLLRASFVPSRGQRELWELTRCRKGIIEERSRELKRLQKVLGSGITAKHAGGIRR